MLAVKETEIAYAKLCEKYFTARAGQVTTAWKQTKAVWTSTQAVSKEKLRCLKSCFDCDVRVKSEARVLFFSGVAVD